MFFERDEGLDKIFRRERFASRMPTHAMKPHEWGTRLSEFVMRMSRNVDHRVSIPELGVPSIEAASRAR